MDTEKKMIQIGETDNVAVALCDLKKGDRVKVNQAEIYIKEEIPFGHKVALRNIKEKEEIVKYGHPIGHAAAFIEIGHHIHVDNLKSNLGDILSYSYKDQEIVSLPERKEAFFMGYPRENGTAGIRNEIWIVPTVGCVNTTAKILEERGKKLFGYKVDGIFAFPHNMGCSQLGEDHERTQHILKGIINNPNAGGVLVLSLGCENNNLDSFKPILGDFDPNRVRFLVTQEVEDEYKAGEEILSELADYVSSFQREKISINKLVLGFKCGGSDAFSGITANPLCGRINDQLVACGGSTILTEVPEMFGAETLLMERAVNQECFEKCVTLINHFKNYFIKYQQTIYENPSPGNKKGGISTLEEKSLGCTQKGGNAPVVDVLNYGEPVKKNGLNLLIGPGNDQISCTNLVASGAQMILFTTGRGNPFGAPVPTVKISSNSFLYKKKKHWMDYNAGQILEDKTFEEMTEDFFEYLLKIASGEEMTQNEKYGYKEISIFRDGVIL